MERRSHADSAYRALFGPYHDAFIGSPTFQIEALSNSISIPRQASPSLKSDSHASRAKAAGNTATSRLASLFGGAAGSGASKTPAASSSLRSAHSDLSAADDADFETTAPPLNLNVILTDRMISWSGVCKEISDSLALHLRSNLLSAIQEQQLSHSFSNLNEIIDYIVLFLKRFEPPLHLNHSGNSSMSSPDWLPPSPSKLRVKDQEKCNLSLFADISGQLSADLVSNALQDVYEIVRQTLRAPTSGSPTEEEKPGFEDSFERDVDQMVEIVETSLTSVLHHK